MNTSRRMSNDQRYFQSYDQFQVHELMLRDRPRVSAYHDAMMNNKHLFENKVFFSEIKIMKIRFLKVGCA
jgi:hypothetical protein